MLINDLFHELGKGCWSLIIAEFLLVKAKTVGFGGAAWEGPNGLIYDAANRTSQETAKFMELLVRRGEVTEFEFNGKPLGEFRGPKNIQKWIGITWEELVKQTPQKQAKYSTISAH